MPNCGWDSETQAGCACGCANGCANERGIRQRRTFLLSFHQLQKAGLGFDNQLARREIYLMCEVGPCCTSTFYITQGSFRALILLRLCSARFNGAMSLC